MAKIQDVLYGTNIRRMKSDPIVNVTGGQFDKNLISGGLYQVGTGGTVNGVQYDNGDLIINFGNKISKFGTGGGGGQEFYPLIDVNNVELREEWHKHTLRILFPITPEQNNVLNLAQYNHFPIGYTVAFLFKEQEQLRFRVTSNSDWGKIQGPEGPAETYVNTGLGTSLAIEKVGDTVWSLSGRATIIEGGSQD